MPARIGISGYGRVERLALRAAGLADNLEFIPINDHLYAPDEHRHLTAASCITNCQHLSSGCCMKKPVLRRAA